MFAGDLVSVRAERDVIRVSWATPIGFFTRITLMQCRDDASDVCINHDVTDVTTVSVSRTNGTLLTIVVWQDRDDVLSCRVQTEPNDDEPISKEGEATYPTKT